LAVLRKNGIENIHDQIETRLAGKKNFTVFPGACDLEQLLLKTLSLARNRMQLAWLSLLKKTDRSEL
jgi:hypothetical protein